MGAPEVSPLARRMQAYVERLQDRIISELERVDGGAFERKTWERPDGGGGRMAVLRGTHLEKAGVNVSAVWGDRNPLTGNPFFATGLSLITHCMNPHAPTVHMNVRYFEETAQSKIGLIGNTSVPERGGNNRHWFGGGMDLTPMGFPYAEDTAHFHRVCREACDAIDPSYYGIFQKQAAEYFYVKHRQRERGVGGIFVDNHDTGDPERDFALVQRIGDHFLPAYLPLLERRIAQPYSPDEKEAQLKARGVYAEFNLAYDRGTRFGFESGGNTEAILVSLPPVVKW